ncbi:MAG: response regulator transcription factor [Candidatus Abawacabacteria bacterium]|nr:response regulator transcription factor [Candidatus Abawacabacteria bacterium]
MKILFVEDEPEVAYTLKRELADAHHVIDIASRKDEVFYLLGTTHYDCLVLDLILQETNGLAICREVRMRGHDIPVLIYSLLDDPYTKIVALESGADDMIGKNTHHRELLARLHALNRRKAKPIVHSLIMYRNLRLDEKNKTAYIHDHLLQLSPKEFQLLNLFLQLPEKVFSRSEILENIWDMYADPFTNKVDVYINFLRKKLQKHYHKDEQYLQTVRGFGYRLAWK